ncbi:carboxymuconolactone decarboxylase family protein [Celerinatantimonas sp. MCCC 1A17872]|uniref:carboxymuconolactone decarboxylase family protein n=1 Tax=Celerinatantimonas sp. MCCC 1A17872 TaxID=3177514 RepID=UPI0038C0E4D0
MTQSFRDFNIENKKRTAAYAEQSPEVMGAFRELRQTVLKDGAVSTKNKELIALGIAIAVRCEGCIGAHVVAAIDAGATRAELIETIDVAVLMGGGPSIVYGPKAYAAVDEFLK